eukprot:CAMPEP_0113423374 /NCGR_PEP_ID=MMETSP0013_2-20120614/28983_1 /TAXON_ID=2843 ORGANISM="Skeletonema costatum, Strain 1716" /NCGR_SAMPLE_ID=MMETSP0013_2 /ASSEMBLY_ACC=CAM_ASM_000158 /LENGTH=364 /DNA_ID=CAMNT_0000311227 /DNA_START=47 /DNA_END=1141 /DNA_ORIENTATION=- /assembly_acc=CAM_ASM_000158
MSMCFRQAARRTLLCTASAGSTKQAIKFGTHHVHNNLAAASTTILQREFSAAAKKKQANNGKNNNAKELTYQERKEVEKKLRRETYEQKQTRLERLKTRRDHSPKDVKRTLFRSWWDKEMMYHNKLQRMAKKEGKPWRVRVAVMVERLPVVTPDEEEWEQDYNDLRDFLETFGKEYPAETGFMFAPDKSEDHVVESDEDMIAGLPFTPAPRETEADASGDVKTLDRQLKTRLYLTIKSDTEGNLSGPRWTLPSTIAETNESLLAAAERAVSDSVGSDLKLWCPSNAPMAVNMRVYNDKLPESFRENYFGEKIFYYRVQYDNTGGDVDEAAMKADDYAWLTREEVVDRIEEERGKHQARFFHYML